MNEDFGIVDKERNPFTCNSWATGERRGLTDNPNPEKNLRVKLKKILNLEESTIRDKTRFSRNNGVYVAFVAIRWGFAELVNDRLKETEKWEKIYLYDDHGQLISKPKPKDISINRNDHLSKKLLPQKIAAVVSASVDRDELIKSLQLLQLKPLVEAYQTKNKLYRKTPQELLDFTFGSNIYRAFSNETPTQRFKNWAWYKHPEELNKRYAAISSQEDHDKLLYELAESLVLDWGPLTNQNKPTRMAIGIALKINNLILKHFAFSSKNIDKARLEWLHVPWDSFTLRPLQKIWTGYPAIPANASQGSVTSKEQYLKLHAFISAICLEAGVPRITYEIWAWDNNH